MTFAKLRALHAAIGEAIDEIEKVYKTSSDGAPLDYPSLDMPYYTSEKHTPEVDKAEALRIQDTVFAASNRIVSAAGQLSATVNKPWFSLIEGINATNFVACLQFLEASNIVEILREAGPAGLHVKDITSKVVELRSWKTDAEPVEYDSSKFSHVLRMLATYHWLREVSPDVFANNRLSSFIDSGKTPEQLKNAPQTKYDASDGVAAYTATAGDEAFKIMTNLTDWLLNDHGTKTASPFNQTFKTPLEYYTWLEEPGNEKRLVRFGHAMHGTQQFEIASNIVQGFPWEELPKDSVVVDVGGGIGTISLIVAEAHPHLRFVIEDRAPVCAIGRSAWGSAYADIFDADRVSYHAQDFFEPQRPFNVPGVGTVVHPDVYLIRTVAHNWGDAKVLQLLKLLRAAAGPKTHLLWVDTMLPYACVDDQSGKEGALGAVRSLVPDGSPLLPNLGRGSANAYILDIQMLGRFDAKERTYREYDALTSSTGWKITRVNRAVGSLFAYTTAVPV
ncbi:S-adenosyl-L-methionine-dependent methyltransferase [Daedaleopsis nitida]|nr:S-adenosyl-L-methionine-dependent methyltransferase [Daedaleopsis nitida]